MRFLMPGAIILAIVTSLLVQGKNTKAFHYSLTWAILMIIAMIITRSENVPIDNQIKALTVNSLPANWEHILDHWESFHTLRTFVSIAGPASVVIAALTSR